MVPGRKCCLSGTMIFTIQMSTFQMRESDCLRFLRFFWNFVSTMVNHHQIIIWGNVSLPFPTILSKSKLRMMCCVFLPCHQGSETAVRLPGRVTGTSDGKLYGGPCPCDSSRPFSGWKGKIELNHRRCTKLLGNHVGKQYVRGFQMLCFLDVFGIYMGVSLNLWYPHFTHFKCWSFVVGVYPMGLLGFHPPTLRTPPYLEVSSCWKNFHQLKTPKTSHFRCLKKW